MRLQLIRNATLRLSYAGHELLFDPCLAPLHSQPSLAGKSLNPTVALPVAPEDVARNVELALVSHLHRDHIDLDPPRLPSNLPLLGQPGDTAALRGAGFTNVTPVDGDCTWNGVHVTRTPGAHGTGKVREAMGEVSGFVLRADGEPTVYLAGDTILNEDVLAVLRDVQPDVIVTHSGGAVFMGTTIIMDAEQTVAVANAAPDATVVAVHLEAFDHMTVTRAALRDAARQAGLSARLLVPNDGEVLVLGRRAATA
ncbi:MBL fold metallo-hydrolase [Deinococcus yavapaiensis]|uniref:L-ascorbate metabolism protein UlaG (Beta-lactamase superfamily) n=1 Tax=Deinococcus yavapaiensis KR-236 TaxID=694435 RepID=A0A318S5G6_9DEIO|nr:MBL fold metallo-hydrolase [Deinococcus yavapaiensis]PYE53795.1 L-ascorbate metabolism protein UlaG (beta-lactamase superfamily) [Deinococcus yavapaiensis KR-236]